MKRLLLFHAFLFSLFIAISPGQTATIEPLFRSPSLSKTHIVFHFADDLWSVERSGGTAIRLTAGEGVERAPAFSPDGGQIAFTGVYDGNTDVFVVPATGGVPKRLTYHPDSDTVVSWTPDGSKILFLSSRNSSNRAPRLFTVGLNGGLPEEVPLPLAVEGCYSPDGKKLAYVPLPGAFQTWKRYRGGMASPIWIADLEDSSIEALPRENWNDFNPMWIGNKIYFLSDREETVTLFSYDLASKQTQKELVNEGLDLKSASAGPGAIVYEQFGSIHLFELGSGQSTKVNIKLSADLPSVRPRFVKVGSSIRNYGLSPTGARAVFEARGEILTVPAKKGNVRNLSQNSGSAERDPAWSPDGKWIAYFSDESGEYELILREQKTVGESRKISLGDPPSYFYSPVWAPDSKKIAYTDKRLNLWYVNLDQGSPVKVDSNTYDSPFRTLDPVWSPDSKWISYSKRLKNHLHAIFVYNIESAEGYQVTDGLSDARFPAFDKGGKYLYFAASTDVGPTMAWLDMFSINHPVSRAVYLVVLGKDEPSPLAPESDEEEVKEQKEPADEEEENADEKDPAESDIETGDSSDQETPDSDSKEEKKDEVSEIVIDLEGIDQRIIALPLPPRNYGGLFAGKEGVLFLLEAESIPDSNQQKLLQFTLKEKKSEELVSGISAFSISSNGEKMLIRTNNTWAIHPTSGKPKPGEGTLNLSEMEIRIDPKAEWNQMYREIWRIERDFLYDPSAHGLDLQAAEKRYEPFLERVASRGDLNYLFSEMLGNLVLGHVYVGGGDSPDVKRVPGGLLGADYAIENGAYRFQRIYRGENWNPDLRAPLTEPGVNLQEGEYLLEVNGQPVTGNDSLYSFFENTAGKSVILKVGPNPDGNDSREVTVVPIASESNLRHRAWIDENRRKVEEMSDGRVGYVYLPNTAGGGFTNFNRYYFGQAGKQGLVVDERFNGGGLVANYIVDTLNRPLASYWSTREGEDFTSPSVSIFGPKAMIINEFAGSGGDWMPWYFRKAGVGPLIGKRTWGGLVGVYDYPPLVDGGFVSAPRLAFWNPDGEWEIENYGVAPDIEVEFDPHAWRQGKDPQLEKAVEWVLEELEKNPPKKATKPAFPDYYRDYRQP
jgi:tricorn protease